MGLMQALRVLRPRVPRPKTFLGIIPLQKGTEVIAATLFFNKLTGVYGLLAILTGFSLSAVQLSAYLYNLSIIVLLAICIPHIRRETPLPNLALAWAYIVDTLINALFTASFAVSWYLSSSRSTSSSSAPSSSVPAAAATLSSTIAVPVTASPTAAATAKAATAAATTLLRVVRRDDAIAVATQAAAAATPAATTTASTTGSAASAVPTAGSGGLLGAHETAASLTLIVFVTVVRVYLCFVVLAYTRQVLQRYGDRAVESSAAAAGAADEDEDGAGADLEDLVDDNGSAHSGAGTRKGKESKEARGGSGSGSGGSNASDDEDRRRRQQQKHKQKEKQRENRHHTSSFSRARRQGGGSNSNSNSNDPFALGSPSGDGWKGKVGRALVSVGRTYWLGRQQDDGWMRDVNDRFRPAGAAGPVRGMSSGTDVW